MMPIEAPPMWEHLLLESPWAVVFVLGAVGVVLWVVGGRRGKARLRYVAMGAWGLAVVVYGAARFVETDREAIAARTARLIHATAPLEMGVVDALIADGAFVSGPDGRAWMEYARIRPELERVTQRYGIEGHSIRGLGVEVGDRGTRGRSVVTLRTTAPESGTGLPVETVWELYWRKEEAGWRVGEIRWVEWMGREPSVPGVGGW